MFKTLKIQIKKREKERKKGKLHRTPKPNVETEVYDNNKINVTEEKEKKKKKTLKSLIGFLSAKKIDNYNRGRKKGKKKNPEESTEQVKK